MYHLLYQLLFTVLFTASTPHQNPIPTLPPAHLQQVYLTTTAQNPLRRRTSNRSKQVPIEDYGAISFKPIVISGKWVKVQCLMECEGCPDEQMIEGWLQWRNNKQLLVELYYAC